MKNIYFIGSIEIFHSLKQMLQGAAIVTDNLDQSDLVIAEVRSTSDLKKIGQLKNKNILALIDAPDRDIILNLKKLNISGILTNPLKKDVVIEKIKSIDSKSKIIDEIKYEALRAKIIAKAETVPPLPKVAEDLVRLSIQENADMSEIIEKIKSDQGLASKVLKLINSPFYGMRSEITSIERAVVYLGLNSIKNIALSMSITTFFNKNFKLYKTTGEKLWEHSFLTARICEEIAQFLKYSMISDALYLAGLFHDIGKVVLVDFLYEDVNNIDDEKKQLNFTHVDVALIVLKKWNLCGDIIYWIKNHHKLHYDASSSILYFANKIVNNPEKLAEYIGNLSEIVALEKNVLFEKLNTFLLHTKLL
jgi:putative nucleotidyltransferase with HDIG domain